jgi:hypothetical protein
VLAAKMPCWAEVAAVILWKCTREQRARESETPPCHSLSNRSLLFFGHKGQQFSCTAGLPQTLKAVIYVFASCDYHMTKAHDRCFSQGAELL